jgi:hypothetical protein
VEECDGFRELFGVTVSTRQVDRDNTDGQSANENSMRSNKKTIQPADVFDAIRDLEFEPFLPRLEAELKSKCLIDQDKLCS